MSVNIIAAIVGIVAAFVTTAIGIGTVVFYAGQKQGQIYERLQNVEASNHELHVEVKSVREQLIANHEALVNLQQAIVRRGTGVRGVRVDPATPEEDVA